MKTAGLLAQQYRVARGILVIGLDKPAPADPALFLALACMLQSQPMSLDWFFRQCNERFAAYPDIIEVLPTIRPLLEPHFASQNVGFTNLVPSPTVQPPSMPTLAPTHTPVPLESLKRVPVPEKFDAVPPPVIVLPPFNLPLKEAEDASEQK